MIEEVRERRIKIFEITFAVIIGLLLLWLLSYELFFRKEENDVDINDVTDIEEERNDEKNIYDIYTSSDHLYTLTIVKTTDQKALNDAKEKYETAHTSEKYRNKDAIYYGYLEDIIFEVTDINEDVKYSLVKGRLLDNENVLYHFIINKETKMIEEAPIRKEQEVRYFNSDNKGLYHTLKVEGNYFFREEYDENISLLYMNNWELLGYIKSDYVPSNNEVIAYKDANLENKVIYDYNGKVISENNE